MSQAVNPVQPGEPVQAAEPVQVAEPVNPVEPIDQEQRLRIRTSLDENLFVEAGAGTGKTTALVSRITALIASGQAEMNGLAAITFTDAAAGELRERVRRELEEDARDERRTAEERERCNRAARENGVGLYPDAPQLRPVFASGASTGGWAAAGLRGG